MFVLTMNKADAAAIAWAVLPEKDSVRDYFAMADRDGSFSFFDWRWYYTGFVGEV